MIPLNEELIQEQRRQDLTVEAGKRRLQKRDPNRAGSPARTSYILLARLGDLLYAAGCNLKTRYGATRYGQMVQPASATPVPEYPATVTAYKGFGASYRGNPLASETGGNPSPCSGS